MLTHEKTCMNLIFAKKNEELLQVLVLIDTFLSFKETSLQFITENKVPFYL